ncbi:MAG: hypothetical protein R3D28_17840 [Geminicoccaceae bacterium]
MTNSFGRGDRPAGVDDPVEGAGDRHGDDRLPQALHQMQLVATSCCNARRSLLVRLAKKAAVCACRDIAFRGLDVGERVGEERDDILGALALLQPGALRHADQRQEDQGDDRTHQGPTSATFRRQAEPPRG